MTGPGAFSVEIGGRTQDEASWIGMVDTIGLLVLLFVAYRNWKIPVLGALPLASAGLAGLGAVALLFDGVHGITVAFGFTLIGVAQDYPIHFFSHQRTRRAAVCERARAVADAGDGRGVDVHRVRDVLRLRRRRAGATRGVHHRRPRHGGADDALAAARARRPRPARSRAIGAARTPARMGRAPAAAAHRDLRARTRRGRHRGVRARCVLAERPLAPDAGASRRARARCAIAQGTRRARRALRHRDRRAATSKTRLQRSERLRRRARTGARATLARRFRQRGAIPAERAHATRAPSASCRRRKTCAPHSTRPSPPRRSAPTCSSPSSPTSKPRAAHRRSCLPISSGTPLQVRVDGLLRERDGHATALVSLIGLDAPDKVAATRATRRRAAGRPQGRRPNRWSSPIASACSGPWASPRCC